MTKYIRNNELITADLDEDMVMLDIEQGKYFSLDSVGKRIWELIETEKSIEELVELLLLEFEVDSDTCKEDIEFHFKKLLDLKMISEIK